MAGICKCEATLEECNKSDLCKRRNGYDGDIMDFKFICNEKSGYHWFKEIETAITESEETNNIK